MGGKEFIGSFERLCPFRDTKENKEKNKGDWERGKLYCKLTVIGMENRIVERNTYLIYQAVLPMQQRSTVQNEGMLIPSLAVQKIGVIRKANPIRLRLPNVAGHSPLADLSLKVQQPWRPPHLERWMDQLATGMGILQDIPTRTTQRCHMCVRLDSLGNRYFHDLELSQPEDEG